MQRNPSIHILKSDLVKVLDELGMKNPTTLAESILTKAKKYKLQSRKLLEGNAKVVKQLNKVTSSKREDAVIFSEVLMMTRRRMHHKGINRIKEGSKDWLMLKEVTELANSFVNDFGLGKKEGYKKYCQIACTKLKPFSLTRFNRMHSFICHEFEVSQDIITDMTPHLTEKAMEIYNRQLTDHGAIAVNWKKRPDQHVHFIKAVQQAKESGLSIAEYMQAQVDGLAWANAIPQPSQLHGDKALERANKFLIKNKDILEQEVPTVKLDFSKIRKIK